MDLVPVVSSGQGSYCYSFPTLTSLLLLLVMLQWTTPPVPPVPPAPPAHHYLSHNFKAPPSLALNPVAFRVCQSPFGSSLTHTPPSVPTTTATCCRQTHSISHLVFTWSLLTTPTLSEIQSLHARPVHFSSSAARPNLYPTLPASCCLRKHRSVWLLKSLINMSVSS